MEGAERETSGYTCNYCLLVFSSTPTFISLYLTQLINLEGFAVYIKIKAISGGLYIVVFTHHCQCIIFCIIYNDEQTVTIVYV